MTKVFAEDVAGGESSLLANYNQQFDRYVEDFPTQKVRLSLHRMSKASTIPPSVRKQPYLKMLIEVCKELQLNELEIALWAIILDSVNWNSHSHARVLLFAGFSAKTYMNEDTELFKHHIGLQVPSFSHEYTLWIHGQEPAAKVSVRMLNLKYCSLYSPAPCEECAIDYNYYVDELLEVSPPVIQPHALKQAEELSTSSAVDPLWDFYDVDSDFY